MTSWRARAQTLGRHRIAVLGLAVGSAAAVAGLIILGVVGGTTGLIAGGAGLQLVVLAGLIVVWLDLFGVVSAGEHRLRTLVRQQVAAQTDRLAAVEAVLADLTATSEPDPRADAELLADLRQRDDVAAVYEAALAAEPGRVDRRLTLVQLLLHLGRAEEAGRYAAAFPGPADPGAETLPTELRDEVQRLRLRFGHSAEPVETYLDEVVRLAGADEREAAVELLAAARTRYPDDRRVGDTYVAVLDAAGAPRRALEVAVDAAADRVTQLRSERAAAESGQLDRDGRIFVSGYFYSGSGAVLDHLRGFAGTTKWAASGEMRLIKFPGGLADLANRQAADGLRSQDLVDLYLHLVGRKVTGAGPGVYDRREMVNRNSRKLLELPAAHGYLLACLAAFVDLAAAVDRGPVSDGELHERFRTLVGEALDAVATDASVDHVLVDQAVTAWRIDIARLVPPSTFVMVHRDPRDQFVEVKDVLQQPGRGDAKRRSPQAFATRYRQHRAIVDRHLPRLERDHGHRFIRLAFEDFVVDHDRVGPELEARLGFTNRELVERRFKPEESRRNVGKHHGVLSSREVEVLRDALPEFLHPAADRPAED